MLFPKNVTCQELTPGSSTPGSSNWTYGTPEGSVATLVHGPLQGQPVSDPSYTPALSDFTLLGKYGNHYVFDGRGQLQRHVDRNVNRTQFTYSDVNSDGHRELQSIQNQGDLTWQFAYDADGRLETVTDFASRSTTFDTNTDGLVQSVTLPDPDLSTTDAIIPETTFGYHTVGSDNALLQTVTRKVTATKNQLTTVHWGAHGQVESVDNADTHDWSLESMLVNGLGRVHKPATDAYIGDRETMNSSTLDEPRATYTDPRGNDWLYQTDGYGLLIAEAKPATLSRPEQDVWMWERDNEHGLVTKYTQPAGGGGYNQHLSELETRYTYDAKANLDVVTYPDSTTVDFDFSPTFSVITSETDQLARATTYTRDAYGNLETLSELDGARVTHYQYTPAPSDVNGLSGGLVTHVTQAYETSDAVTTKTDYYESGDHIGLPEEVYSAYGISGVQTSVGFTYDAHRNVLVTTDEKGRQTTTLHDDLNRLVKVIEPDPGTGQHDAPITEYAYDGLGQMTSETTPREFQTTHEYDDAGRLSKVIPPAPGGDSATVAAATVEYQYDANGNLRHKIVHMDGDHSSVDENTDRVTVNDYDARNLLQKETSPKPFPQTVPVSMSDVASTVNKRAIVEYRYDALGQPRYETDPRNAAVMTQYLYDKMGRMTRIVHPESHDAWPDSPDHASASTHYVYDDAGRLEEVKTPRGYGSNITYVSTNYEYDALDRQRKEILPPDDKGIRRTTIREYDLRDNLVNHTVQGGTKSQVTTRYYDKQNRVVGADYPDPTSTQTGLKTLFAYDLDGTLLRQLTVAGNISTGSDVLGSVGGYYTTVSHLDTVNASAPADAKIQYSQYAYDDLGRVAQTVGPEPNRAEPVGRVTTDYVYDTAGNVTQTTQSFTDQGVAKTLTTNSEFDGLGRVWHVSGPADPSGVRPETTTAYTADGQIYQSRQKNTDTAGFVYWTTTQYAYDHRGRPYAILGADPGGGAERMVNYTYFDPANNLVMEGSDFVPSSADVDQVTLPKARSTEYTYDNHHRRRSTKNWIADAKQWDLATNAWDTNVYPNREISTIQRYNVEGTLHEEASYYTAPNGDETVRTASTL